MTISALPAPDPARLLERLAHLVGIDTQNPPGRETDAAGWVAEVLRRIGFTVAVTEFEPGRANVVGEYRNGPGPVFAFNSHLDVVPAGAGWSSDPLRLVRRGDRLYGRGACDAKGPIAAMLEAIDLLVAFRDRWSGTLEAVFVADEEASSRGAKRFAADRPAIDLVIVGEPTDNTCVIAHKGSLRPLVRVRGVSAHSGTPDRGVNAILKAARLLGLVEAHHAAVACRCHPLVGAASLTVTRITGGVADNVVPDGCDLLLDRRLIPGESESAAMLEITELLKVARADFSVEAAVVEWRPTTGGATETAPDHPIVNGALAASRRHGVTAAQPAGFEGACDLVHFRTLGAQGLVLGPGSLAVAHKPDEFVPEAALPQAALIYRDTVLALLHRAGATG